MKRHDKIDLNQKKDSTELYDFFFHEARFPIVERHLSPENAKKFRKLSNEDKGLFVNILIKEGILSW
jgi:hypothetical protein